MQIDEKKIYTALYKIVKEVVTNEISLMEARLSRKLDLILLESKGHSTPITENNNGLEAAKKTLTHGANLHNLMQNIQPKPKERKVKKQFTDNNILNEILNSTNANSGDVYVNPLYNGAGLGDDIDISNYGDGLTEQAIPETDNELLNSAIKAQTRDYGALMNKLKELDKKKGKVK